MGEKGARRGRERQQQFDARIKNPVYLLYGVDENTVECPCGDVVKVSITGRW